MKKCFIIMPFSKTTTKHTERYWTDHYQKILKPKIESVGGIRAERSKAIRGQIIKDIITDLIAADIVVADLTDANPNVFYELGIRQSFKHGTITIAEYGTKIPFDVKGKGVLFYHPRDLIKNSEFESDFLQALKDCIENPNSSDSVVLETISGRGSFYELVQGEETKRRGQAIVNEFTYNQDLLEYVFESAQKLNDKSTNTFPIALFRLVCIELLISNRYLSKDKQFYRICEQYYGSAISLNAKLIDWPFKEFTERTTKWLMKNEKYLNKAFSDFKKAIQEVKVHIPK